MHKHKSCILVLLIVAACSSEPAWLLVEKGPPQETHVALEKEGGLVRARLRSVAEKTPGKPPTYTSYTVMLVNCEDKSVRMVSHEVIDDALGATIVKHAMPDVFNRPSNWDAALPKRFCDHVMEGRPWA